MIERIVPDTMAKPVGSYSHANKVTAKQLIFIAGQVPVGCEKRGQGGLLDHHAARGRAGADRRV